MKTVLVMNEMPLVSWLPKPYRSLVRLSVIKEKMHAHSAHQGTGTKNKATVHTFLLFLLLFSIPAISFGQNGKPEMITDRPDQSTTPYLIPKGALQIESGASVETDESTTHKTNTVYNNTLIKYGIHKSIELAISSTYVSRIKNDEAIQEKGFTPFTLGAKVHVADEHHFFPQVSVVTQVNLKAGLKTPQPDYPFAGSSLAFSHTLSEKWMLTYNTGVIWDDKMLATSYFYTIESDVKLSSCLTGFIEAYGSSYKGKSSSYSMDAGILFRISGQLQADLAGGFGITENAPDFFLTAGLALRMFR